MKLIPSLLAATFALASFASFAADGLVSIKSAYSAADTATRLENTIKDKGLTLFARINHSAGAEKIGNGFKTQLALEGLLSDEQLAAIDCFDRLQLQSVIEVCRSSRSLSEAGRTLFDKSRAQRAVVNDADRLRKYLQKFGLSWDAVAG